MRKPLAAIAIVTVVSLSIWYSFYMVSEPLTLPETIVVVGFAVLIVLAGQQIWARLRKRKTQK